MEDPSRGMRAGLCAHDSDQGASTLRLCVGLQVAAAVGHEEAAMAREAAGRGWLQAAVARGSAGRTGSGP